MADFGTPETWNMKVGQFIEEKEAERKLVLDKYAKDSKRFIELRSENWALTQLKFQFPHQWIALITGNA